MRILQVHNYYKFAGGEDVVVEAEKEMLSDYGHTVFQYTKNNREIKSIWDKVKLLLFSHYSNASYREFFQVLRDFEPDIVHVHNIFPLITPSIFKACKKLNIPVVMTLHNYRIFDPSAYLLKRGKLYDEILYKSALRSIFYKPYRNSYLQSAVLAFNIEFHKMRDTWNKDVDVFIALTEFSRRKFIEGGIDSSKIFVKPNFCREEKVDLFESRNPGNYFLFVGRLSEEKGVLNLLKTWDAISDFKLVIIGDGPLKSEVESCQNESIVYLGKKKHDEVLEYIKDAKALIFPSEWYETFGMVLIEALSIGTPVIVANIGSQKEIIRNNYTGLHYKAGDSESLKRAVYHLYSDDTMRHEMSENAKKEYSEKYTVGVNVKTLMSIYEFALTRNTE